MALFDTVRPATSTGSAQRIGSMFVAAFGVASAWNDARITRKAMGSLSDRELQDIGMVRGDIDDVAKR